MEYEEFIRKVQKRSGLGSSEETRRASGVVIETVGAMLERTERNYFESLLADELRGFLSGKEKRNFTTLDEFYSTISSQAGISFSQAIKTSHAVIAALSEAVPEGELDDILSSLPDEFREISGKRVMRQ